MTTTTDTPRTDAAIELYGDRPFMVSAVPVEFAEGLERELAASKAEVARLKAEVTLYKGYTVGFGILHCSAYGEQYFGKGLLHPEHYEILKQAGCRMDSYKKATFNPADK